jgi:hypothetical protein
VQTPPMMESSPPGVPLSEVLFVSVIGSFALQIYKIPQIRAPIIEYFFTTAEIPLYFQLNREI